MMQGVVPGGAKLVEIDLTTDEVVRTIVFDADDSPHGELPQRRPRGCGRSAWAYLTESGTGALIVVDLQTRRGPPAPGGAPFHPRRLQLRPRYRRQGATWARTGNVPLIHADGIALSPDDEYVYYHALTGDDLYRIPAATLRDACPLGRADVAAAVEYVAETVVTDGMIADAEGNLYHSALERDAIIRYTSEGAARDGGAERCKLLWPDSFAFGPDGHLYVTISQIHKMPQYNGGVSTRTEPYRVFRVDPD